MDNIIYYCEKCGSFFGEPDKDRENWGVDCCPQCEDNHFVGMDADEVVELLEQYRMKNGKLVKRAFPIPSNGITFE